MGAREVLRSCAGWLMVSASRMTSWRDLANSKILSISLWTSADEPKKGRWLTHLTEQHFFSSAQIWHEQNKKLLFLVGIVKLYLAIKDEIQLSFRSPRLERVLDRSIMAFLFSTERFASDRSAVTRVIEILRNKKCHIHNASIWWRWTEMNSSATKNKSSSSCVLLTMKRDRWNPTNSSLAQSQHYSTPDCSCRGRNRPTCHRICALGSQTRLSASCLLPGWETGERESGEVNRHVLRNLQVIYVQPCLHFIYIQHIYK